MRFTTSWPGARVGSVAVLLCSSLSPIASNVQAYSFPSVPTASLDLSDLGRVALAGDFDAVSLFQYKGQDEDGLHTNGSQSLLGRYPTGAFASITSADAYIASMCPFTMKDGTLNGIVVGGNFTSLGGQVTEAVALFDPNSGQVTPLPGLTGMVNTVYCDKETETVYVGGSFTGAESSNAIAWVTGWTNLPFAGFNGPVASINKLPNGNILFSGSFTGVGNTSTPSMPNAQVVNLGTATVTGLGSTDNSDYSNPKSIICKTDEQTGPGNSWLLQDGALGAWNATFQFGFQPTKLRLLNAKVDGYGTKSWFLSFPAQPYNGIANFSYFDENSEKQWCTNNCPLANNGSYQDFYFVNPVGMNSIQINITEYYGTGGGLGGIELFQNNIYAMAVEAFNEPKCDGVSTGAASVTVTGTGWEVKPSGTSYSDYLSITLPDGTASDVDVPAVTFAPSIKQSGNYTVTVWTPGCVDDDSCAQRGVVDITANLGTQTGSAPAPLATQIYQTNNYLKSDQVFFTYVEASSDSFTPTITLSPAVGQDFPLTVVAQSVQFQLVNSSGGLNGLYEFNRNQLTSVSDYEDSAYDKAGTDLDEGAEIISTAVQGNTVFAAGKILSDSSNNIFAIVDEKPQSLPGGGLNDVVQILYADGDDLLYVGGNFTNTRSGDTDGLSNVAVYSSSSNDWSALGAGVNGIVYSVVPLAVNASDKGSLDCIAISGYFNQVNSFENFPSFFVEGLAIWVPSEKNWLENLNYSTISLTGRLNGYTSIPGLPPLYAGTVNSQALAVSGVVSLTSNVQLEAFPLEVMPLASASGPITKRAELSISKGAATGLYYMDNDLNITVVAGRFDAVASDGSMISNLALINGSDHDTVSGLPSAKYSTGTIGAVAYSGTSLFAGGSFSDGIVVYDLVGAKVASNQPPPITGSGGTVTVNAIAPRPSSQTVYVGGEFDAAGSLPCYALCIWDMQTDQWQSPPASPLSDTSVVNALQWAPDSRLVIAGDLHLNGNHSAMANYDAKARKFTSFTGADLSHNIPGPITTFSATDSSYGAFFVAGTTYSDDSAFLMHFDGSSTWTSLTGFGSLTNIEDLQVLTLNQGHASNKFLGSDFTLLVMGLIELAPYGNVSAALYDGKDWSPFLMSTLDDGSPGSVRSVFVENTDALLSKHENYLALGFIVLIGLAISLALIFLIVVAGILAERIRRRRQGYVPAPTTYTEKGRVGDIRAEELFGGLSGKSKSGKSRI